MEMQNCASQDLQRNAKAALPAILYHLQAA